MGAFMVIAVIAMGILFLGGVNARMFFLMAAIMVSVLLRSYISVLSEESAFLRT